MRTTIWRLVLPLTIISFALWTKWWMVYALQVEAPDIIMIGFPLAYAGDGWQTSMSLQIFFTELIIDLIAYFLFWCAVVFVLDKFIVKIQVSRIVGIVLQSIAVLFTMGLVLVGLRFENLYYLKRPFDMEVLDSGYKFYWEGNPRPDDFNYQEYEKTKTETE